MPGVNMPIQQRHQLIYSDLLRRLQAGEWKIGDKFPTTNELMYDYEYSHRTIFKAVQQMANMGYLKVNRGRAGTFVAKTSPVQNIGLLMNEYYLDPLKTPYPYVIRKKICSALEKEGFSVLHFFEREGAEFAGRANIVNFANALKNRSLRGIIMFNCSFPQYMNDCPVWREFGVPYVKIGKSENSEFNVDFDIKSSLETTFKYFADHGLKKVALIYSADILPMAEQILLSFPELQKRPEWVLPFSILPDPEEKGFQMMTRLWQQKNRPNAVFVSDDIAAKGVIQAALHLGIKVPDDLLIIHHANSDTNVFYPVNMPKIEFNLDEIVEKALGLLKNSIANPNSKTEGLTEMVAPRLVEASQKRKLN
jgi:DNA-binding LacI/PurR family transcriptional regulator